MVDCKVRPSNSTFFCVIQKISVPVYFVQVFAESVAALKTELANKTFLVWDKDDKSAMDFVTACANVRAYIFSIQQKSRFQIKCKFVVCFLLLKSTIPQSENDFHNLPTYFLECLGYLIPLAIFETST